MKTLIDIIKQIESVLSSLENLLKKEYHDLLNSETADKNMLESIEKKTIFIKKFIILSQHRLSIEKKIGMFAPYKNNYELNNDWNEIIKKCSLLRKINIKNKILINKKFHLNQYFLELFPSHQKAITYNLNGNLKI